MCEGKLDVSKIDDTPIDDIERANQAVDAWHDAQTRAQPGGGK